VVGSFTVALGLKSFFVYLRKSTFRIFFVLGEKPLERIIEVQKNHRELTNRVKVQPTMSLICRDEKFIGFGKRSIYFKDYSQSLGSNRESN
jgi:hypothetical protein